MKKKLTEAQFEELVADALDDLPPPLAQRISNVGVVVEPEPPYEAAEAFERGELLGLYEGVPLTERDSAYSGVLPDRITLYKQNLEEAAEDPEDLKTLVKETVIHEVAHHFGIDDDRLEELGWA